MVNSAARRWLGLWEILLSERCYLRGFVAGDAHHLAHDAFGGWIEVTAPSLPPGYTRKPKSGSVLLFPGPRIDDMHIEGNEVVVECSPASTIMICGRGSRTDKVMGEGLQSARLPLARFQRSYFRITVVYDAGRKAWSNPVWLQ